MFGTRSGGIRFLSVALAFAFLMTSAAAVESEEGARRAWQLLDYVAVDYAGAVQGGKVVRESEFQEMNEFASTAATEVAGLPNAPARAALQAQAEELRTLIADKADAGVVAAKAHTVARELIKVYPFAISPSRAPDLALGESLFASQCSACHGADGHADGPLAASLQPRPTNLADRSRARERSLAALYQAVTQGVSGTAMPSFKTALSDDQRWALAFFAGGLSYSDADRSTGADAWRSNAQIRQTLGTLDGLAQATESALASKTNPEQASHALAWARSHPSELAGIHSQPTALVRSRLEESAAALKAGDRAGATRLALSAYLDGFEPLEPALKARDPALMGEIETAMGSLRASLADREPAAAGADVKPLLKLLDRVDARLAPAESDAAATFFGALTILLREGLEALLVVVAMIAFLRKAERRDVLPYVHAGWIIALAAGGLTWFAATYLVRISGASRELTEGFSSLFAAAVLLGVGMWMHQKSVAGRWQIYLRDKLSAALNTKTAWLLFTLSFVAVYREVFETVLFYAALWTEGNGLPLLAGLGGGLVLLAVIAAVLLRTSARLPIGQFFAASSVLVAVLAFVLAGKGMAALQEAGVVSVNPVSFPQIDLLGVHPSVQVLLTQGCVVAAVLVAYWFNMRPASKATVA